MWTGWILDGAHQAVKRFARGRLRTREPGEMETIDDVADDLRRRLAASPFHASLGLQVEEALRGQVRLAFVAKPEHRNLQGLVHGGVLATLGDIAMGLAVRTAIPPGRRHVTIEMTVHFLRPAEPGVVTATGRVVRVGSRIAFAEADVTDANDRLLARTSGTYSVLGEGD
jgi:uncharacterized protein (TIGR00369 family)